MTDPSPLQPLVEPQSSPVSPNVKSTPPAVAAGVETSNGSPEGPVASVSTASAKIGGIEGDTFVGGQQTFNHYNAERQERSRLSRGRHFDVCNRDHIKLERENLLWSTAEVQELVATLENRRFIIIHGEPELGKGGLARLLAATVCSQHNLSEMLYCRQIPAREMEIPFDDIFGGSGDFRNCAIIMKDVLARNNGDIHHFLLSLDVIPLETRIAELRSNKSFLIFTTDSERLGDLGPKLQGLSLLQPIMSLRSDILIEILSRLTESLKLKEETDREALKELLREQGKRIVDELKTVPRLVRFVRESLPNVLVNSSFLEQALRRANNLESWLLRDLPEDPKEFDAWCYVVALVLCDAVPLGENVIWMHFDRFRQLLSRHLRQELRRFGDKRSMIDLCREEELARLARAEVQQLGYPQAAIVAFSSDSYPTRLWKVLLGPGRHLLAFLVPFLRTLTAAPEFYLRTIAARALGRIGELDPFGVTFLQMQNLGETDDERRSRLLGQVVQGALSSDDLEYGRACLRQLRNQLRSRSEDVVLALMSLREVGELDLPLALKEMRDSADYWLLPRTENGKKRNEQRLLKAQLQALEDLAQKDSEVDAILRAAEDGYLRRVFEEVFSNMGNKVLDALQYALVGLFLGRQPMLSLISELYHWADEDASEAGQFLVLLFLRNHGILETLDHISILIPVREDGTVEREAECGIIIYSLTSEGDNMIASFQAFLEALHARLADLPGRVRQGLRKRWLGAIKNWVRQASAADICRPSIVSLLRRLVRSSKIDVRRDVLAMLQGDRDFLEDGSDLKDIALESIAGVPSLHSPGVPRVLSGSL